MKNLYHIQTLLVMLCLLLNIPFSIGQVSDPVLVNVKNTGSSYIDQFYGATDYYFGIVEDVSPQLGVASIALGSTDNTIKVTFTPEPGAVGTTDLIVTYYTSSPPMHPVSKWYRFNVNSEIVLTQNDRFLVDLGAQDVVLDVLENDSTTGAYLVLQTVSVLNTGTASINTEENTILFTPDADFTGDTWLQYIACDSSGVCAQGNVHVLVRDPGLQDHQTYQKYLLNQESLQVLTPFEGFDVEIDPSHGTLDSTGIFSFVYKADIGFVGKDTFQLGLAGLVTRTYIVTVYSKNVNVQAIDDRFYVRPGLSVSFNVLNNDLLVDYELSTFTNPTKGVLFNAGNGSFTYTATQNFRGVDKFTYTTCFEDTVYCETATVLIHVTDLEPENTFTYKLQTSTDLPLTIDYPVTYTDFSYIISNEPDHGVLNNFVGLQTIDLPCDTIEAFNMLVYEPEAGYTGTDHFEYYYCIQPSNLCYLVKVDMDVLDAPESESCPCVVDCVWPGDANSDGRVDMNDLLVLGNRMGETGIARDYNNPTTWFGQHADDWDFSTSISGDHFLDGNGDGVLTEDDVDVISTNYYRSHDVVVRDVHQKVPYQFSIIPVQFSLDSGDVVILDISFGNGNVPVLDMKGAKFSVNVPAWMLDSSSVQVIWHQDSWLAEGTPFISMGKVPWDGRIDAGYANTLGNGSSGFGVIATIVFIIEDDLEGFKTSGNRLHIPISLEGGSYMGNDGSIYDADGDEIILTYIPDSKPDYQLVLFPNPAHDFTRLHINGKTEIEEIQLFDVQGRSIYLPCNIEGKQAELNIGHLSQGLYFVQVRHTKGILVQTLSIID